MTESPKTQTDSPKMRGTHSSPSHLPQLNSDIYTYSQNDKLNEFINNKARENIPWNATLENSVKNIGEMALSYKMMHMEMAQRAHLKYNLLMYVGIIFAPMGGVISQMNTSLLTCNDMYVSLISLTISFISGVVIAIIKFTRYDEIESSNKLAASKYTSLESNVRRQLSLYRNNRIDASDYMEWVSNSFDELFMSSPLLPRFLFDKYHDLALKNGRTPPNRYGNTININEEYEQEVVKNICKDEEIIVNTDNDVASKNSANSTNGSCKRRELDSDSISQNESKDKTLDTDNSTEKKLKNIMLGSLPNLNSSLETDAQYSNFQVRTPLRGTKVVKRSDAFIPFQELNKYSDPMMVYQMKRFMAFKE